MRKRRELETRPCQECGAPMQMTVFWRKYCCKNCRMRGYYRKQIEEQDAKKEVANVGDATE